MEHFSELLLDVSPSENTKYFEAPVVYNAPVINVPIAPPDNKLDKIVMYFSSGL
jgi:hypothetical protein